VQGFEAWLRRYGLDLALTLLLVQGLFETRQRETGLEGWLGFLAVAALVLPLFARRRFPFAAPVAVWILGAAFSFVDGQLMASSFSVYVTGVAAAYLLGNLPDQARSRIGLAIVLMSAAIVVYNDPNAEVSEFVTIPATFAIAWVAGLVLRTRAEQAEAAEERADAAVRERETAARVAVAEERSRITRELHDVVAHAVSVMVLQVGAVRHRLPDSLGEDKEALEAVEHTGRSALSEMRRLLGVIHDGDRDVEFSPQPGLDRLDTLIEEVRLAGLEVRLQRIGEPIAIPRAIDLSAYRIVQEGLTNCLKHARATRADVTVRYGADDLEIEILDDGVGPTVSDGLGHGMTGIRERVKIYGGDMSTGAGPGGGFQLDVRLPIEAHPR
jgi:signal transduction histidine kinase